uniref:Uncharacterized LOC109997356 n=1 Tax=Labrus bergylta TaxID=56723 RepID=A0A3Q3GU35_9LABR
MSDPETQYQPLVGAPSQQTAVNEPAQGGRPSRAYKVAGLTLLACILIAGQAMVAYFLLSQGSDIKSLEEQNNNLQAQLMKGRSSSGPMRMHMPMNALSDMLDVSADEETSTTAQGKDAPEATECQLEASGLKTVLVPGFRPSCGANYLIGETKLPRMKSDKDKYILYCYREQTVMFGADSKFVHNNFSMKNFDVVYITLSE